MALGVKITGAYVDSGAGTGKHRSFCLVPSVTCCGDNQLYTPGDPSRPQSARDTWYEEIGAHKGTQESATDSKGLMLLTTSFVFNDLWKVPESAEIIDTVPTRLPGGPRLRLCTIEKS